MSRWRPWARAPIASAFTVAAWAAVMLAGCAPHAAPLPARPIDGTLESQSDASAEADGRWPYAPQSIRIHPLTRQISPSTGGESPSAVRYAATDPDIEVRVECFDDDGEGTRTTGTLWLEIAAAGRNLAVGPLRLDDRRTNREYFESVTRTYRIEVNLPPEAAIAPGESISIRARLRFADGSQLTDRYSFTWR